MSDQSIEWLAESEARIRLPMTVRYRIQQDVAVISLDHAPTNSLNSETRLALMRALSRADEDNQAAAIILHGSGSAYCSGADINEFNSSKAFQTPDLPALIAATERIRKPVVAALHGVAMGGGLELALACHFRVAVANCRIALPEVRLGLIPGAGGTQRLPRALGIEVALNMILGGKAVEAKALAGMPGQALLDALVDRDEELLDAAIAVARGAVPQHAFPRVRDLPCTYPNSSAYFQFARNMVGHVPGRALAKQKCIDAIQASVTMPFASGLLEERRLFDELLNSHESKAMRHVFLAERAARKIADVDRDMATRQVQAVAVIGAGTMGRGICMNFLNANIPVTLMDVNQDALNAAIDSIRTAYEAQARKGAIDSDAYRKKLTLLRGTCKYTDVSAADLVIEAVFEEKSVKESVFKQLDAVLKPGAIIASNTSTLDLDWLASLTHRPQDVVGMHFFSPAHVMRLLEVVRGKLTGKDVLATAMEIGKRINKVCVVSGVCDGFIGNRMIDPYLRQALFLLEEGCSPQQVDTAMEKFGFAMGPFRMSDLAGNDVSWAIRKRRYVERPDIRYSRIADALCELGRFGQKVNAGWYDYSQGNREAAASAVVHELVSAHRLSLEIAPRNISDDEIVHRLVFALVNEGAKILEDGIADKASDIDVVYVTGYGFPVWRGGPMHYASQVGLWNVREAMRRFARNPLDDGPFWKPASLIDTLAEAGQSFDFSNMH